MKYVNICARAQGTYLYDQVNTWLVDHPGIEVCHVCQSLAEADYLDPADNHWKKTTFAMLSIFYRE